MDFVFQIFQYLGYSSSDLTIQAASLVGGTTGSGKKKKRAIGFDTFRNLSDVMTICFIIIFIQQ